MSPFVTRPNEVIADRKTLKLAPVEESVRGVYNLRKADKTQKIDASIILQESAVTIEFITKVLPMLDKEGFNLDIFYISSAELFDMLPEKEKLEILNPEISEFAFGITGFTLPTMYKWITGYDARKKILHPFKHGYYLGSGSGESVMREAGLDAENLYKEVKSYIDYLVKK